MKMSPKIRRIASCKDFGNIRIVTGFPGKPCLATSSSVFAVVLEENLWGIWPDVPVITQPPPSKPFYGPFSGTTRVSRCQKITSGLYGATED